MVCNIGWDFYIWFLKTARILNAHFYLTIIYLYEQ